MKKKEKEKRPYSALSNFWYTLKILFKTNAWHPIFEILATLTSLGVAVWVTYENKFFLDALETGDSTNRILLAMAGIVGVTMALRLISLVFNYLRMCQENYAWGKLHRRSFDTICGADYDKMESPEYKNIYSQYVNFMSSSLTREFYAAMQFIYSVLSAVVFGTVISTLHPLIVAGLIVMAVLYYVVKRPLAKIQQKMNLRLVANDRKFQYVTRISSDFANAKEVRLYHMQECRGLQKRASRRPQRDSVARFRRRRLS